MTFRFSRALAPALPLLLAACVDGDYNKFRIFQAPLMESVESLRPGETDLASALDVLGAPVFVVEVGLGMALAWGWQATTAWNVEVSGPIGDAQGQFQFSSTDEKTEGLVLFFDPSWKLVSVQTGHLADLVPKQQRPRDVEDDLLGDLAPEDPAE